MALLVAGTVGGAPSIETAKKLFPSSWRSTSRPVPEKRAATALPGQDEAGAAGSEKSKRPRSWMSSVGSLPPVPLLVAVLLLVASLDVEVEVDDEAPPLPAGAGTLGCGA